MAANKLKASALSVEQILEALENQVIVGRTHLRVGIGLQKADPAVLHTAHVFFGFTIAAHLEAAQMYAARLFDKTAGTVTIPLLLKRMKTAPGLLQNGTPTDLQVAIHKAEMKLPALEKSLESIGKRRNEWLTHTDPTTVANPRLLSTNAPITPEEIEEIFNVTAAILNGVLNVNSGVTSVLELAVDQDDYEWVCKLIADAKCAEIRAFEREYGAPAPFQRPRDCK